jgi:hypothetical protein
MARLPEHLTQPPPWSGPQGPMGPNGLESPTQNENSSGSFSLFGSKELKSPASYPFSEVGHAMFPPVCLRSHWDPEQIIRRTLPTVQLATPLEPRPWTKICLEYTTTQDFEDAPRPNDATVMPTGGSVYPPSRYREAVDNESLLRRLDRPLGTCEADQYRVPLSGGMYKPNSTVQRSENAENSRFIQELAFPMACIRSEGDYECRSDTHHSAWARSRSMFNNATKQERYSVSRPDLVVRPTQPTRDRRAN